jgi:hypothetical protein
VVSSFFRVQVGCFVTDAVARVPLPLHLTAHSVALLIASNRNFFDFQSVYGLLLRDGLHFTVRYGHTADNVHVTKALTLHSSTVPVWILRLSAGLRDGRPDFDSR